MNELNLNEAMKKRIPTKKEAKEILKYLKAHPKDKTALPTLAKKYNCSLTSLIKIIIEGNQGGYEHPGKSKED